MVDPEFGDPLVMNPRWYRFRERRIKKYEKLGNFTIEPWDERYYALFDGNELICVTVYKKGAIEVMRRLWEKGEISQDKGGEL